MFKELRRKDRMMDNESAIELLRSSNMVFFPLWEKMVTLMETKYLHQL